MVRLVINNPEYKKTLASALEINLKKSGKLVGDKSLTRHRDPRIPQLLLPSISRIIDRHVGINKTKKL